MTTASGEIVGFSIDGHAGFGEAGTDIVCAAVSSAAYMTVNTITEVLHADAHVSADDGIKVGTPYVDGASVTGKVLKTGKAKKVTVFTYKPKKGSKRKMGHRQPYTKVEIASINA